MFIEFSGDSKYPLSIQVSQITFIEKIPDSSKYKTRIKLSCGEAIRITLPYEKTLKLLTKASNPTSQPKLLHLDDSKPLTS